MAAPHSPSTATPRRVLGDLTPKAINTPSKQTHGLESSKDVRAQSPLKQVTTLSPQVLFEKENIVGVDAYPKGRKRSIYEVEGAEDVENAKSFVRGREESYVGSEMRLTTSAVQIHTENDAIDIGVPGSPTECNTPTPEPEPETYPEPELGNSQGSNQSFSGWLNLEMCASQNSDTAHQTTSGPAPTSAPAAAPLTEDKKSRAELLKLRLGLGMYKVKTNQVSKRSSDIISTWETTSSFDSLHASTSTAITSSAEHTTSHTIPSIQVSPARRETHPKFVKANLDPFRPIGKLTPAPVLLPTTVSSRMIHDYHMPSSPPQSVSPEQLLSPVRQQPNYVTPTAKRVRTDTEDDEEEEEEDREETVEERLQRLRERRFQEGELTSSVVKGHAAKGLLELMSGRR